MNHGGSRLLVQGLKPAEIAERLSISPEAARARKSRAVKRIAEFTRKLSRRATR